LSSKNPIYKCVRQGSKAEMLHEILISCLFPKEEGCNKTSTIGCSLGSKKLAASVKENKTMTMSSF